jgi:hypothetical protein
VGFFNGISLPSSSHLTSGRQRTPVPTSAFLIARMRRRCSVSRQNESQSITSRGERPSMGATSTKIQRVCDRLIDLEYDHHHWKENHEGGPPDFRFKERLATHTETRTEHHTGPDKPKFNCFWAFCLYPVQRHDLIVSLGSSAGRCCGDFPRC